MFKRGRSHVGKGKQRDRKESKNKNGDNKTAMDDKRRERSTVSLYWPPVNLVKGLESRGEESKVKGMLRPPQPSSPSPLLLLSYLPQQNRAVGEEERGGVVVVIKLQTFPHLMVLCHVSAFLHSSLPPSISFYPLKFQGCILYCNKYRKNAPKLQVQRLTESLQLFFSQCKKNFTSQEALPASLPKRTVFLKQLAKYNGAIRLLIISFFSWYLPLPPSVCLFPYSAVLTR